MTETKTSEQQRIEELEESNKALSFFSNQANFNLVVYQNLSLILEKLEKLEEKINKIELELNLPKLPDLP